MIKAVLWDVDGTILDFDASEKAAIRKGFETYHLGKVTDEMIEEYSGINKKYWEKLERKELTKIQVLEGRFEEFFTKYAIPHTRRIVADFNSDYQVNLGDTIVIRDDAVEIIKKLKAQGLFQGVITNGTKVSQDKKLRLTGLGEILKGHIYISEVIGVEKPDPAFFKPFWEDIVDPKEVPAVGGPVDPKEVLVVGDSLTSDILGGINIGATTVWYNYKHQENHRNIHPDYEIEDLHEIFDLIG